MASAQQDVELDPALDQDRTCWRLVTRRLVTLLLVLGAVGLSGGLLLGLLPLHDFKAVPFYMRIGRPTQLPFQPPQSPPPAGPRRAALTPQARIGLHWNRTEQSWQPVLPDDLPHLGDANNTVVVFDQGSCHQLVETWYTSANYDLSANSGGEILWCHRLLQLLQSLGYGPVVVGNAASAEAVVQSGLDRGVAYVTFVHSGWWDIVLPEQHEKANLTRPPFRQGCLVVMDFWGVHQPARLWPGDVRFYLTVYPHPVNTYAGLRAAPGCPISLGGDNATQGLLLEPKAPYGVVYGKFNGGTAHAEHIYSAYRNASLWASLRQQAHIVFVACSDSLAAALGLGADYEQHFHCWNRLPQKGSYQQLLLHAAFVIGLGTPPASPTPIEALQCRTPVIMPPQQFMQLAALSWPRQFHPVRTTEDVLAGVSACLRECRPRYQPTEHGDIEKVDDICFATPSPMIMLLTIEAAKPQLKSMLDERHQTCSDGV